MAFGGVIGEAFVDIRPAFDKFAGELKSGVSKAADDASKAGNKSFDSLATVGKTAFLGIAGAVAVFGGAAIKAALEGEESTAQLAQAVRNAGGDFEKLEPRISKLTDGFAKFGYENDQAEAALTRLVQITHDSRQSMELLSVAADVAAARHIDLTTAAQLVGRVAEGNITPLKRLGITVADTGTASGNAAAGLKALHDTFGGAAQAQADTYAGKLAAFKATLSNLTEEVGNFLLPKLATLTGDLAGTIGFFEHNRTAAILLAAAIGGPLAVSIGAFLIQEERVVAAKLADTLQTVAIRALYAGDALRAAAGQGLAFVTTLGAVSVPLELLAAAVGLATGAIEIETDKTGAARREAQQYIDVIKGSGDEVSILKSRIDFLTKSRDDEFLAGERTAQQAGDEAEKRGQLRTAYTQQSAKIDELRKRLKDLQGQQRQQQVADEDTSISQEKLGLTTEQVAAKLGVTVDRVGALASALKINMAKATDEDVTKLAALQDRLSVTDSRTLSLRDAIAKYTDATADATAKSQAFKTALDLLIGGNVDAERAVVTFEGAVDGLGAKLKENKLNFDAHTQAGRDNISAIEDAVIAARNHVEALQAQGAGADALRGALAGDTTELRDQLKQAGLTTAQIDALVTKYGLVPSSVNTLISADPAPATAAIDAVQQKFAELARTLEAPLQVFVTPNAPGGGPRLRVLAHGDYFDGSHPEVAIVGDVREVVLPLDDPKRMAELLARAGVGRGPAPAAATFAASGASQEAAAPTFLTKVYLTMPGLATAPEAAKLIADVARGEVEGAMRRTLAAASAGAGSRGG